MDLSHAHFPCAPAIVWSRYHLDDFGSPQVASSFEIVLDRWGRPVLAAVIIILILTAGRLVLRNAAQDDNAAPVSSLEVQS